MKSKIKKLIERLDPDYERCYKCKRYFLKEYLREYSKSWKIELPKLVCPNCIKKILKNNANGIDGIQFKKYEK